MPWPRSSWRSELVSDQLAAFEAQYIAELGMLTHESTERTLMMAPPPFALSTGANARLIASGPNTFVSNSRRAISIASSARDPVPVPIPALFTISVTSPQRSAAAATSSSDVTSSCTGTTPAVVTVDGSRAPRSGGRLDCCVFWLQWRGHVLNA